MKLSVFLGAIRPQYWGRLYNSIVSSIGRHDFELVLCGPAPRLPGELANFVNVKYIRDFGSCSRGAQLASLLCEGDLVTLGADDAVYRPQALEKAVDFYDSLNNPKAVVGLCYGENQSVMSPGTDYWTAWTHKSLRLDGISKDSPMFLNTIIKREYWYTIGGYDCSLFETCNWGGHDLMQRLLKDGAEVKPFMGDHVFHCDWFAAQDGDHKPIHLADSESIPDSNYHKFVEMYNRLDLNRIKISVDTWRQAETIWSKRFNYV